MFMQSITDENYKGIDISNWQGTVDFNAVKTSGVQIVYLKATEGDYFEDPYLNSNYINAKSAGLLVSFYHYFKPTINAKAQAKFFIDTLSNKQVDCRLALDIENSDGYSPTELSNMCIEFLQEAENLSGDGVVVYTYTYFAQISLTTALSVYPLWIAHYGAETPSDNPIWDKWVGFQYSSTGNVPGVNGPCDLNVFTPGIFFTENLPINPDPVPPPCDDKVYYTVQPGDTLSEIAIKYGISWEYLAQINNLSDPNLIYPGQVLIINSSSSIIPPTKPSVTYTVQYGDTLSEIAASYNTTWEHLAQINNISNTDLIYQGQVLIIS